MSFRLISVPLFKRTEQDPIDQELIVDNIHGNIGISVKENDEIFYNSGIESNKTDFQSLKIRNKLISDDLIKISYGSENNTSENDFDINKALENKDILGSLQYLYDQYNEFISTKIDDEGNVVLKESAFQYSDDLKKDLLKLYSKEDYSYSYKFRKILEDLYIKELNKKDENNKDESVINYLKLQKLVNDCLPILTSLDSKLTTLECIIDSINKDLGFDGKNGNINNVINELEDEIINLQYNTKCKKFKEFNITSDVIPFYQTENNDNKYLFEKEPDTLLSEQFSRVFDNNFITSILDDNYDGDINQFQIDSIYNSEAYDNNGIILRRNKPSYISNIQNYYYIPTDNNYYLVYDPIECKPMYRYLTYNNNNPNNKFLPFLENYTNDNNFLLQQLYGKTSLLTCNNLLKDSSFEDLFSNETFFEDISNLTVFESYYLPSIYSLYKFSDNNTTANKDLFIDGETTPTNISESIELKPARYNFNYDYFVGHELFKPIITKTVTVIEDPDKKDDNTTDKKDDKKDENTDVPSTQAEDSGDSSETNPTDPDKPNENPDDKKDDNTKESVAYSIYYLLRDSINIYNYNDENDDYADTLMYTTGKNNERFMTGGTSDNPFRNNKPILAKKYYKGFSTLNISNNWSISVNQVKKDFSTFINSLENKLTNLSISDLKFPTAYNTDLLIDKSTEYKLLLTFNENGNKVKSIYAKTISNDNTKTQTFTDLNNIEAAENEKYVINYNISTNYKITDAINNIMLYYNNLENTSYSLSISSVYNINNKDIFKEV